MATIKLSTIHLPYTTLYDGTSREPASFEWEADGRAVGAVYHADGTGGVVRVELLPAERDAVIAILDAAQARAVAEYGANPQ